MRVLVCGGRDYANQQQLETVLDSLDSDYYTTLIHGAARGADTLAAMWAASRFMEVKPFPADWDKYGRSAGAIRNQRMLDEGKPDLVVAFPGGAGTALMVKLARKAGVEVLQVVE